MTAQIGVINRLGIVLASDSAVTVADGHGRKIYNSVNKIFSLTKSKSIAIMIYGGATFSGLPWETIISVFKEQSEDRYESVEICVEEFMKWLELNLNMFFTDDDINEIYKQTSYNFLRKIQNTLLEKVDLHIRENGKISDLEVEEELRDIIVNLHNRLKANDLLDCFEKEFEDKLIMESKVIIDYLAQTVFEKIKLNETLIEKLNELVVYRLTRNIELSKESGLVIAGFGSSDVFPSLYEITIGSLAKKKVTYKYERKENGSFNYKANIFTFAQSDTINHFLYGLHPSSLDFINDFFGDFSNKVINFCNEIGTEESNEFKNEINFDKASLLRKIKEHMHSVYANPIKEMVDYMPMNEVCELADSLVSLTSLRKKVTMEDETVGGETEVLYITRGEGMVWKKRK